MTRQSKTARVGRGVGVHLAALGVVVATVRGVIARGHGVEGVHLEVGQADLLGALAGLELEARVVGEHQESKVRHLARAVEDGGSLAAARHRLARDVDALGHGGDHGSLLRAGRGERLHRAVHVPDQLDERVGAPPELLAESPTRARARAVATAERADGAASTRSGARARQTGDGEAAKARRHRAHRRALSSGGRGERIVRPALLQVSRVGSADDARAGGFAGETRGPRAQDAPRRLDRERSECHVRHLRLRVSPCRLRPRARARATPRARPGRLARIPIAPAGAPPPTRPPTTSTTPPAAGRRPGGRDLPLRVHPSEVTPALSHGALAEERTAADAMRVAFVS